MYFAKIWCFPKEVLYKTTGSPQGSPQLSQLEMPSGRSVGSITRVQRLVLGSKMLPGLLLLQYLESREMKPRTAPMQSSALLQGDEDPHQEGRLAHPHTDRFSFSPVHAWGSPEAELRSPSFPSWTLERKRRAQLAVPEHPPELSHSTGWGFSPKAQSGHQ